MKIAYVDATAGVSGDMLMAALVDAGGSPLAVDAALGALKIEGLSVQFTPVRRAGLGALFACVKTPPENVEHRTAAEVLGIVSDAPLPERVKVCATAVFQCLIDAEALAHGVSGPDVHLHEVGAYDSIADVVGVAALLDDVGLLAADSQVMTSSIAAGSGTVHTAHGVIPVPAPAVLNILSGRPLSLSFNGLKGECTTPTGAAILASLAMGGEPPSMRVLGVGAGAGARDTSDRPNVTRVVLGEAEPRAVHTEANSVELIECTVDDLDPQFWPDILASLRAAGALDCWTTRITGRHGRSGEIVSVLTVPSLRQPVIDELFWHTGTFGVRSSFWRRDTLDRVTRPLTLPSGAVVDVKIGLRGSRVVTAKPEPAQVSTIAREQNRPVRSLRDEIVHELHRQWGEPGGPTRTVAAPQF